MFSRMAPPSSVGREAARRRLAVAAVLVVTALCARRVAAQELRGNVRDSVSHQPIAGAVLMLLDSSGVVLGRRITDETGHYVIALPGTARWARMVRIGFQPREMRVPARTGDVIPLDVTMVPVSTMLATVRIRDESRCSRRNDRAAALGLWEQVRAGLLATVVARETNTASIHRLGFARNFDGASDRVTRFLVNADSAVGVTKSFNAAHSAEAFVKSGFATDSGGVETLFAPDADVLLDDAFASAYCFQLAAPVPTRANQVGLEFEPSGHARGRVDIDGTLWVDTAARALCDIEYRYLGLEGRTDAYHPGGRISFLEMQNGSVMIDRWVIRGVAEESDAFIDVGRPRSRDRLFVTETGGELESARWPDGRMWHASLGTLHGSAATISGKAAAGTVIALPGTHYRATTDSAGDAVITDLLPGPYSVEIVDPRLAPIGLWIPAQVSFLAARDSTVRETLKIPSAEDWVISKCMSVRQWEVGDSVFILGRVLTTSGRPVADTKVNFAIQVSSGLWGMINNFFTTGTNGVFQSCSDRYTLGAPVRISARPDGMKPVQQTQQLDTKLTIVVIRVPPVP